MSSWIKVEELKGAVKFRPPMSCLVPIPGQCIVLKCASLVSRAAATILMLGPHLREPHYQGPSVSALAACNKVLFGNSVRGCRGAQAHVWSPRSSSFWNNEAGLLVHFDQQAAREIAYGQIFARFPAT